ncbi:uncharacterized protein LOC130599963 isoform X4 [Pezoporus wallicus]|uniref:uncharacterized protein LOC130599963 isoform X4 n=1 Tax=Pezoporus wallicus TaxID=35540 RepID=UPI00254EB9C4|nr:uncharacterized protein LOC130599963 isoform X4 [Pezoporus wallicus]
MATGAVWGKNNALDVELDFPPFWDERMLPIPCQEAAEVQGEGKEVFKTSPPCAMNIWLLLSALVYLQRCLSTSTREQGSSKTHIFYTVEIDGYSNTASFLAKQHGMQFISKILYRRKMRSLVKPTMSLTLKKDSETHWCLMTLIGLHKRNCKCSSNTTQVTESNDRDWENEELPAVG